MLTYSELKELSTMSGNGNFFISLYLNVNPLTNPKGDYVIHFKNMLKDVAEKADKDTERKVKDDLGKIESYLKANRREFRKGIAIISSSALGFWKNYHLSLPVKNELIIDKTPYIKPLLFLLDNYQRCAVLLVDKELARIFIIHMGEIVEYTELFSPNVPGRHKKGGWFSLQQSRFERHIDYHVALHIKDVAKALEDFLRKEAINRIIIGGSEDAIIKIKDILPRQILKKLFSTFHAEIILGEKEVLKKTLKIIEEIENEKERDTVEELITRTMKNDMAVIGLEDVLTKLQERRIMKLIFLKDMKNSGFKCTNCGFLTSQTIKSCPYCEGKFEEINFLIDFAAQKAVEQGVLIEVVTKSDELAKAGGIGAFLRF
jgi:peptide chain release factor subunit 1